MFQPRLKTPRDLEKAFLKYSNMLYSYIYLRVRNRETAEDIAQEVFMNAWRSRETFDSKKASLKNWLFTIAVNEIRDHIRKNTGKPTADLDSMAGKIPDEKENIPEKTAKKETEEKVMKTLDLLEERDRELIILRYKQDISVKEIAKILKLEYSAAKVALHRAVKKLRKLCENE